jgi:hypothetical protein
VPCRPCRPGRDLRHGQPQRVLGGVQRRPAQRPSRSGSTTAPTGPGGVSSTEPRVVTSTPAVGGPAARSPRARPRDVDGASSSAPSAGGAGGQRDELAAAAARGRPAPPSASRSPRRTTEPALGRRQRRRAGRAGEPLAAVAADQRPALPPAGGEHHPVGARSVAARSAAWPRGRAGCAAGPRRSRPDPGRRGPARPRGGHHRRDAPLAQQPPGTADGTVPTSSPTRRPGGPARAPPRGRGGGGCAAP